jgi:hypothetical protein
MPMSLSPSRDTQPSPLAPRDAQSLRRLRDLVAERLERIEALARAQLDARSADPSAEVADARTKLQAEREAWDRTRQAQLEEIETNRRLLAEAWERLEAERIEAARHPATPAVAPTPAPTARPPAAPILRSAELDASDSVTRSIMREFQVLRRDVRHHSTPTTS